MISYFVEFANGRIGSHLLLPRLRTHRGTSFLVTDSPVQHDPDQATEPMVDGSNGLIVSQARYQSAIDDVENGFLSP